MWPAGGFIDMQRSDRIDSRRLLQRDQLQPLLSHVDSEEAALRSAERLLREIPQVTAQPDQQKDYRAQIERMLKQADQLQRQRAAVLTHTGRLSGLRPDQVTMSQLIRRSSPNASAALVAARDRLRRLTGQIQQMSAVIAGILGETRMISSVILDEVIGGGASDRYNASGQRSYIPTAVRFETRS